ncbi:DUF1120 domain-containing protein [Pseudomonas sp. B21-032]|uniref:DUF1120 domain-containing protein n=1 Tax=Pseudomonas sp. B21-032 TaxID=2895483 RepID=UPI00215E6767|nr:DUF1120 domain-containing protein [Pseudomonas sp. B21-032]UVL62791.1 DUF1120 domain-containing protein [Pseudomonas sp. B21-032]
MRLPAVFLLGAFAVAAPAAFASSGADLTLAGTIKPEACEITTSGRNMRVGTVSTQDLNRDSYSRLANKWFGLYVHCKAPTRFALKAADNRADSAVLPDDASAEDRERAYGLGWGNGTKIGYYLVNFKPERIWTRYKELGYLTHSSDQGINWNTAGADVHFKPGEYVGVSTRAGHSTGPSALTYMGVSMDIEVNIAPLRQLDVSENFRVDGSAVVELNYL